jgi:hypothetical protein
MSTVTNSVPDVFAESFEGFADELPAAVEFFRPESLRPVDADGFELPSWDNPYFQIPDDDPDFEPSDDPTADFEPTVDDSAWVAANPGLPPVEWFPSEEDWNDYHEYCDGLDADDEFRAECDARYEARCRYAL